MTMALAQRVLELAGPGRILHYGCRDDALTGALLHRGCDAWGMITDPRAVLPDGAGRVMRDQDFEGSRTFDCVVVGRDLVAGDDDLEALLVSLRGRIERSLVLCLEYAGHPLASDAPTLRLDNARIEQSALAAGYRRHPACFPVARYERLNDPAPEPLLCFEKIPDDVLSRWPMEFLLANRDLHMDMSREASPRSDAHLVRYALAAEWIRPGDTILDCACGLGYGTALLAAASRGSRFIGVDIDAESIAYAKDNFAGYPVEYRDGPATDLGFLPDHSVDMVVSFETIEHLEDYESFLREIARVLKPDGRVIGSVPNLWVDETGKDPNPHHFHAFDYAKIRDAFARHFIVETRYGQTAPGGVKLVDAPRRIDQRPLETDPAQADTEWWIVVAAADPSRSAETGYMHPEFDSRTAGTNAHVTAFAAHYENPWIYRQLIQNGQRIRDPEVLSACVESAAKGAKSDSADLGAMLTVRAYQTLQARNATAQARLLPSIERYLELRSGNPHIQRWQISLSYVAALLALDRGQRERGKAFLETVTGLDPLRFSPLISTKTVAAYFLLGTMHLVDGRPELARSSFVSGVESARRALHAPDENAIGHPDRPLAFGFFELAEIADMAGQCATAIQEMDRFPGAPGLFWRAIDTRRFGLLSWLKNLELESARLRAEIRKPHPQPTLRDLLRLRSREFFPVILPALIRGAWKRLAGSKADGAKPQGSGNK